MTSSAASGTDFVESRACCDGDSASCRRLAVAGLLSAILHVTLLASLVPMPGARGMAAPPAMQARLVTREHEARSAEAVIERESVVSAVAASKEDSRRPRPAEGGPASVAKSARPVAGAPTASALPLSSERPSSSALAAPSVQIAPAPASSAGPGRFAGFRHVEMAFELSSSNDASKAVAGHAVYSASDGHYGIAVQFRDGDVSQGDGAAPALSVSGAITSHGLSPETFTLRGNLAEELHFMRRRGDDAGAGANGQLTGRFRDGLLDRQSLLFHFSLQPPNPGGGQILLSDGKGYVAYSYRVEPGGREPLPPLGDVSVLRITLQAKSASNRGGEKVELYLVPEMGFLPVRMRYTNEFGQIIEQRVTGLNYR